LTIGWDRSQSNGVFHKVRKTPHLNPEFGPKPDEIIKKNAIHEYPIISLYVALFLLEFQND
jgi:hypothetical protein